MRLIDWMFYFSIISLVAMFGFFFLYPFYEFYSLISLGISISIMFLLLIGSIKLMIDAEKEIKKKESLDNHIDE